MSWLADSLMMSVAGIEPKSTAVTLARLVPVMVTCVPPAIGPLRG